MKKLKPAEPSVEVHSDHAVIRPPNTLRAKALTVVNDPNYDQTADIERADRAVEALAPSFEEWLVDDIEKLRAALVVFNASPKYEVLAVNRLGSGEQTNSSLAVADGEIFIRTFRHLWCISARK